MDSEDGEVFVKQLAAFVRTHEKALANALQFQRRDARHRASQSTSAATLPQSPTIPDRPATSASTTTSLAAALSLGSLSFTSHNVKSAKLALTPHHLFYLLSRFEELSIEVGPMKVRLENLHDSSTSANYVSFLGNTGRSRSRGSDVGSIHSVSSMRSVMSGMSSLWSSFGIGASISAARTERQKAAAQADLKYLYSAFTKIPCLRLAPDWRARLISGYEEFPFDSAVPLYVFKNLQALEVSNIDFRQFFGWDRMADQLRSLSLKRAGIEDPADILIDIVLDDMDKRRRRTSKNNQASPTTTWVGGSASPRRSPTISHPELQRAASAPGSPEPRLSISDMRVGSLASSDEAVEDTQAIDIRRSLSSRDDLGDPQKSPSKGGRPRSNSPARPGASRNMTGQSRNSQRVKRSGSSSSHSSLSESWHHHHHSKSSGGNLLSMGILPASKWRFLRHLSLADNAITSIPSTSLAPLSNTLFSLDLSSNLFSQVPDSLATLTALRALNLSHCMIDSLHSLTRNPLPAITALNLRANRLQSLAGVEKLYPLERLDLRDNRLTDPMELARLTGIPDIRELWVEGNPFTRTHKDYRITIFNLFRRTPGYTEDITLDGYGPSYSERRQLVDRAPIPESVPVVKPKAPEVPVVEVVKPTIIHTSAREPTVLQKERPVPKTATSEVNTSSSRRRKASKRRIVDLATGDTPPSPIAVDVQTARPNAALKIKPVSADVVSPLPEPQLVSPIVLPGNFGASPLSSPIESSIDRTVDSQIPSPRVNANGHSDWKAPQDWDTSGDIYRRKIEELRDKVGNTYLSVLSEESWDPALGYQHPGLAPAVPLRPAHTQHHTAPAQAIHSGRTLG
jgi:hypothetical protein